MPPKKKEQDRSNVDNVNNVDSVNNVNVDNVNNVNVDNNVNNINIAARVDVEAVDERLAAFIGETQINTPAPVVSRPPPNIPER